MTDNLHFKMVLETHAVVTWNLMDESHKLLILFSTGARQEKCN